MPVVPVRFWGPLSNRACSFPAHGLPMVFMEWRVQIRPLVS